MRLLGGAAAAARQPIFRRACRGGEAVAVDTRDVNGAVREVARAAGCDPGVFGAHSPRIGAATDMRDLLGAVEGKAVVKARGRWKSDIHEVYERASLGASLDASARAADVGGREVEAVFAAWVQPAR